MAEQRDVAADPREGDVFIPPGQKQPFPATVQRVSKEAQSVHIWHRGATQERPLIHWPGIVPPESVIYVMPDAGSGEEPEYDVPAVELTPAEANAPASGGPGTVHVQVTAQGTSGTWIVDQQGESLPWLHITFPIPAQAPQSTDAGDVTYNVDANQSDARTAALYINGKTFTLTQAGVGT